QAAGMTANGRMPIALTADLVAEGIKAESAGINAEQEQQAFLRREKVTLQIKLVASDQPIEPGRLGYVLLDSNGNELGRGALLLDVPIPAGLEGPARITDAQLLDAARIHVRKLP